MSIASEDLVRDFLNGEVTFNFKAGEFVFKNASRDEPEIAWQAIVELSRQPLTQKQVALLAAGPLEDLLAYHGLAFIERVEREARVYATFRQLLGGVWRNSITKAVWDRVQDIRTAAW